MKYPSAARSPHTWTTSLLPCLQGIALLTLTVATASFCASGEAFAAAKSSASPPSSAAGKKPANRVTYRPSPSEETRRERERRLERECRNKPNAGACAGFGYGTRR